MEEKIIKDVYNQGAIAFKKYIETRDIEQFAKDAAEINKKYGKEVDACGLMGWWAQRVDDMHKLYVGGKANGRS